MNYDITEKMIVEEYLNNWFTYQELAQYLCISLDEVENTILNIKDKKTLDKIKKHYILINLYNSNPKINNANYDVEIIDIANYIIKNHASIRETAEYFKLGKSTVFDRIHEKLPYIDIYKYKEVFDVLVENKSFDINKKEIVEQILNCYILLKNGLTTQEICNQLGIGRNVLQRNLTTRLYKLDKDKALEVKEILKENQLSGLGSRKKI